MEIRSDRHDSTLVMALDGRLDTTTAPQLENEIKNSITGINEFVIDCTKLEYISSAGLRVLLTTQKAMAEQGSMKLRSVNSTVMDIFNITGFCDILNIE